VDRAHTDIVDQNVAAESQEADDKDEVHEYDAR
jgi:hypothetical protein